MSPLATILRPDEQLPRAGSAGRAAINVETRVVDDDGNPVAPGEVREDLDGLEPGARYVAKGAFSLKAELGKDAFGDGHGH